MKTKYFKNIQSLRIFLLKFNKRFNVKISSMQKQNIMKRSYKIEYDLDNVNIYINKNVKNLNELFTKNKNVKTITFENFDASNIESMNFAFVGLELDDTIDLSGLDLSNMFSFYYTFSGSIINGDIILPNKMPKLKAFINTFGYTVADKIVMILDAPELEVMEATFTESKINQLILDLNNSKIQKMYSTFSHMKLTNPLNLENIDFSRLECGTDMLKYVNYKLIDFGNNNRCNPNIIIKDALPYNPDNQTIKVTKKMGKFLNFL